MGEYVAIAAILLFILAVVVGFFAGIVITLAGGDGSGLVYSCGMPFAVMLAGVLKSRKGK